jgi:serine/threonine protein kinase
VFEGAGGDPQQQQQQQKQRRLAPSGPPVHHSDSFLMDSRSSPSDIYARPVAGGGGGFKAPLTRMVCTPCYRAPEVVMSRGGYTGGGCCLLLHTSETQCYSTAVPPGQTPQNTSLPTNVTATPTHLQASHTGLTIQTCASCLLACLPSCVPAESIDMWGCGCVFGELLQRVAWIGKATTPQLQVRTLCAHAGLTCCM